MGNPHKDNDKHVCVSRSYLLDGKLQWEEEAHVDRDNSNEVRIR